MQRSLKDLLIDIVTANNQIIGSQQYIFIFNITRKLREEKDERVDRDGYYYSVYQKFEEVEYPARVWQ